MFLGRFPLRKILQSTNSQERLNEEIQRRERVIRIFPNEDSAICLIGALLSEFHEQWSTGKKYLDMTEIFLSFARGSNVLLYL
jgi:transposase-like protein